MRRFRLSPEAQQDIRAIWRYIARDSVEAASRVRRAIHEACRSLARRPGMGHRRDDLTTHPDVRFWTVYSFLIIYRLGTKPLQILRVLHAKRDVQQTLG
jgi:plasmid stabilization system protein ParE